MPGFCEFSEIIGQSPGMRHVRKIIERVARTTTTVLINGRTGTGKELVAWAIHGKSARASRRFVDINCGALPEHLFESIVRPQERKPAGQSRKLLPKRA